MRTLFIIAAIACHSVCVFGQEKLVQQMQQTSEHKLLRVLDTLLRTKRHNEARQKILAEAERNLKESPNPYSTEYMVSRLFESLRYPETKISDRRKTVVIFDKYLGEFGKNKLDLWPRVEQFLEAQTKQAKTGDDWINWKANVEDQIRLANKYAPPLRALEARVELCSFLRRSRSFSESQACINQTLKAFGDQKIKNQTEVRRLSFKVQSEKIQILRELGQYEAAHKLIRSLKASASEAEQKELAVHEANVWGYEGKFNESAQALEQLLKAEKDPTESMWYLIDLFFFYPELPQQKDKIQGRWNQNQGSVAREQNFMTQMIRRVNARFYFLKKDFVGALSEIQQARALMKLSSFEEPNFLFEQGVYSALAKDKEGYARTLKEWRTSFTRFKKELKPKDNFMDLLNDLISSFETDPTGGKFKKTAAVLVDKYPPGHILVRFSQQAEKMIAP